MCRGEIPLASAFRVAVAWVSERIVALRMGLCPQVRLLPYVAPWADLFTHVGAAHGTART